MDDAARNAAAVAGACADLEAAEEFDETRVDAKRLPPPKLKRRNCCCTSLLGMLAILIVLVVFGGLVFELRAFELTEVDSALERRIARDSTVKDQLVFGVWDSKHSITKLQLQVATSMALGVRADDGDVSVDSLDSFFFNVRVEHATVEEVDYIASDVFIDRLNVQMAHYGGIGVLSKPPHLVKIA